MEVDLDEIGVEALLKSRHHLDKLFFCRGFWKLFDRPVVFVRDAQPVQKGAEQIAMGAYQPDLQDLRGQRAVSREGEVSSDVLELVCLGLPFKEDRAQFLLVCDRTDSGLVERFFVLMEMSEEGTQDGLWKAGENLVRLVHKGNLLA